MYTKVFVTVLMILQALVVHSQELQLGIPIATTDQEHQAAQRHQLNLAGRVANEEIKTVSFSDQFPVTDWSNPSFNFLPSGIGQNTGDINGDGRDDLIRTYRSLFDATTADLTDRVNRTLVFLGSEVSKMEPDQVVDAELFPVGDMNGDGFSDAIGIKFDNTTFFYIGSANGFQESEQLNNVGLKSDLVIFRDFNNDGHGDVLMYDINPRAIGRITQGYSILFGADVAGNFQMRDYPVSAEFVTIVPIVQGSENLIAQFWIDESGLLQHQSLAIEGADYQTVLRLSGTVNFSALDASVGDLNILTARLNDDVYEDVLITSKTFSTLEFNNIVMLNSEDGLRFTNQTSSAFAWRPIGDFDNDGIDDFVYFDSRSRTASLGKVEVSPRTSIIRNGAFPGVDRGVINDFVEGEPYIFGDLNGDGFDDLQFGLTGDGTRGNRTFFGNANNDFNNSVDVLYATADASQASILRDTKTLQDFNGDGINDLLLLFLSHMEIYLGGGDMDTPDFIIDFEDNVRGIELSSGHFNDDALTDFAVSVTLLSEDRTQIDNRQVRFYYGSESFDGQIDHIIDTAEPTNPQQRKFIWSVQNIGDFNNDGVDDIGVMTFESSHVYIYLGGQSISSSPDFSFDLEGSFGFEEIANSSVFSFGYKLNAVGDINGDGIDDFAVSDLVRNITSANPTLYSPSRGVVFIFQGSSFEKGTTPSQEPDHIIFENTEDLTTELDFFGWSVVGADFNGDGENDLIILPRETNDVNDIAIGKNAVFIYNGGADFDREADQKYAMPAAPFGVDADNLGRILGEVVVVPDLNNDGAQELLVTSDALYQNAVLFMGGDNDFVADAIFQSPNQATSLGVNNAFVNIQFTSALGDFNGDRVLEIVLPQTEDRNFRNIPIYVFPVRDPNKEEQVITFPAIESMEANAAPFELVATSSSGLEVAFEVTGGPASVEGTTLTLEGIAGVVFIKASQAGNDQFFAAEPVEQFFDIGRAEQTISFEPVEDKGTRDDPFEVTATASSGLTVAFEIVDGPAGITDGTVTLDGVIGTVTISASQAGNDTYRPAESVEQSFEVILVTGTDGDLSYGTNIFPNPATHRLSIQSDNLRGEQITSVVIRSLSGKLVKRVDDYQQVGEATVLDLGGLKNGLYLVELSTDTSSVRLPFIKQ